MKLKSQIVQVVKSSESDVYSEIIGMNLIALSIPEIGFHLIQSPLDFYDYDRYWHMLFKGHFDSGSCGSETFEEFKVEAIESGEMDAYIRKETASEFKVIRDLSEEELEIHSVNFSRYFNIKGA
ncbi:hypothetical protein I7E32_16380 [Alcaligenes faecalis]|nr:hypothetical protein [Alcaligenes faecalis]